MQHSWLEAAISSGGRLRRPVRPAFEGVRLGDPSRPVGVDDRHQVRRPDLAERRNTTVGTTLSTTVGTTSGETRRASRVERARALPTSNMRAASVFVTPSTVAASASPYSRSPSGPVRVGVPAPELGSSPGRALGGDQTLPGVRVAAGQDSSEVLPLDDAMQASGLGGSAEPTSRFLAAVGVVARRSLDAAPCRAVRRRAGRASAAGGSGRSRRRPGRRRFWPRPAG